MKSVRSNVVAWMLPLMSSIALAGCAVDRIGIPGLPNIPVDSTTPVTGTATLQQRMSAMDGLQTIVNSLSSHSFDANTSVLVQAIQSLPQFAAAGSSADGTVWGMFKGGVMLYIVAGGSPNTPTATTAASNVISLGALPRIPARAQALGWHAGQTFAPAAQATTTGLVPGAAKYHLLNGLGSVFSGSDPRSDIAAMLDANGYSGTQGDATLPTLRTIAGDGVFYIRTHGGLGLIKSDVSTEPMYALWTATEALDSTAEKGDATLSDDLAQNRVVYMLFRNDRWNQAFPTIFEKTRHYGITEKFVQTYMSFAANAFVYLDACRGAAQPTLLSTFHGKNASVIAGWTDNAVILNMGPTAKYVFDRMLGANTFAPEDPAQRPFEFGELLGDPKFGPGNTYGYTAATASDGTPVNATLIFDKQGGDFSMLAPSILQVASDEADDQLVIAGDFGPDPGTDGKVTIDDGSGPVALAVVKWTAATIMTDLKRTGAGSAGNVIVTLRGHHSNARQLLAWNGTLHYTMHEVGSLTQTFDLDFQARVDPLDIRFQIAQPPLLPLPPGFTYTIGEHASYSSSGSYTLPNGQCSITYNWGGQGVLVTAATLPKSGQSYIYAGTVSRETHIMEIGPGATDPMGLAIDQVVRCPTSSNTSDRSDVISFDVTKAGFTTGGRSTVKLSLDDGLSITGGSIPGMATSMVDGTAQAHFTLTWSTISPHPRFDSTLPR